MYEHTDPDADAPADRDVIRVAAIALVPGDVTGSDVAQVEVVEVIEEPPERL